MMKKAVLLRFEEKIVSDKHLKKSLETIEGGSR